MLKNLSRVDGNQFCVATIAKQYPSGSLTQGVIRNKKPPP
jgi:hypothetical protein